MHLNFRVNSAYFFSVSPFGMSTPMCVAAFYTVFHKKGLVRFLPTPHTDTPRPFDLAQSSSTRDGQTGFLPRFDGDTFLVGSRKKGGAALHQCALKAGERERKKAAEPAPRRHFRVRPLSSENVGHSTLLFFSQFFAVLFPSPSLSFSTSLSISRPPQAIRVGSVKERATRPTDWPRVSEVLMKGCKSTFPCTRVGHSLFCDHSV